MKKKKTRFTLDIKKEIEEEETVEEVISHENLGGRQARR
jgi:hypothetical protein